MKQQFSGECDWCRQQSNDLVEHQDFEEGLAGQAWDVCAECRRKEREAINKEEKQCN
jgi:hypothetical protein